MKLLYFAWLRERVGVAEESVELPSQIETVGQLIAWLAARGETYAHAFEKPAVIRVALDKRHVRHEALIGGASEIAFFPPMTGG